MSKISEIYGFLTTEDVEILETQTKRQTKYPRIVYKFAQCVSRCKTFWYFKPLKCPICYGEVEERDGI